MATPLRSLTNKIMQRLPGTVAARLDLIRPHLYSSWGGAFNGQRGRQALVRRLFQSLPFDFVVETGSFRGVTTEFLQIVSGLPVYSVEYLSRYYLFAKARCAYNDSVHITHGDSRAFLQKLSGISEDKTVFVYLDAHWNDDVPRYEELRIIREEWGSAVVMIDDFVVPGDAGYQFAIYGGKPLDRPYLPDLSGWSIFYPTLPSSAETGARRGCAVFATNSVVERALSATPELYRSELR